jgi:hypothetical protein
VIHLDIVGDHRPNPRRIAAFEEQLEKFGVAGGDLFDERRMIRNGNLGRALGGRSGGKDGKRMHRRLQTVLAL